MSKDPRLCHVSIQRRGGGSVEIELQARTLYEATGLALVEFRRQGIENPGLMQVTFHKPLTYAAHPDKFWQWLNREGDCPPQEREIRGRLRDLLCLPLTREEKRQRRER